MNSSKSVLHFLFQVYSFSKPCKGFSQFSAFWLFLPWLMHALHQESAEEDVLHLHHQFALEDAEEDTPAVDTDASVPRPEDPRPFPSSTRYQSSPITFQPSSFPERHDSRWEIHEVLWRKKPPRCLSLQVFFPHLHQSRSPSHVLQAGLLPDASCCWHPVLRCSRTRSHWMLCQKLCRNHPCWTKGNYHYHWPNHFPFYITSLLQCFTFCDQRPGNVTQLDLSYLACYDRFENMKACFWQKANEQSTPTFSSNIDSESSFSEFPEQQPNRQFALSSVRTFNAAKTFGQ